MIISQTLIFLAVFISGMLVSSLIFAFSLIKRHKSNKVENMLDALGALLSAAVFFVVLQWAGWGEIRIYNIIGYLLGLRIGFVSYEKLEPHIIKFLLPIVSIIIKKLKVISQKMLRLKLKIKEKNDKRQLKIASYYLKRQQAAQIIIDKKHEKKKTAQAIKTKKDKLRQSKKDKFRQKAKEKNQNSNQNTLVIPKKVKGKVIKQF